MSKRAEDAAQPTPLDRRAFLTRVLTTSGAVAAGLAIPARTSWHATLDASGKEVPRDAGLATLPTSSGGRIYANLAADGLPMWSVSGIYVGMSDTGLVVNPLDVPVGPTTIKVNGATTVYARDQRLAGDMSLCAPGDRVFVGTIFDSLGRRLAEFVFANAYAQPAESLGFDGTNCSYQRLGGKAPDARQDPPPLTLLPHTKLGGVELGANIASAPLAAGALFHFVGMGDLPTLPTSVWAISVDAWQDATQVPAPGTTA